MTTTTASTACHVDWCAPTGAPCEWDVVHGQPVCGHTRSWPVDAAGLDVWVAQDEYRDGSFGQPVVVIDTAPHGASITAAEAKQYAEALAQAAEFAANLPTGRVDAR